MHHRFAGWWDQLFDGRDSGYTFSCKQVTGKLRGARRFESECCEDFFNICILAYDAMGNTNPITFVAQSCIICYMLSVRLRVVMYFHAPFALLLYCNCLSL